MIRHHYINLIYGKKDPPENKSNKEKGLNIKYYQVHHGLSEETTS